MEQRRVAGRSRPYSGRPAPLPLRPAAVPPAAPDRRRGARLERRRRAADRRRHLRGATLRRPADPGRRAGRGGLHRRRAAGPLPRRRRAHTGVLGGGFGARQGVTSIRCGVPTGKGKPRFALDSPRPPCDTRPAWTPSPPWTPATAGCTAPAGPSASLVVAENGLGMLVGPQALAWAAAGPTI